MEEQKNTENTAPIEMRGGIVKVSADLISRLVSEHLGLHPDRLRVHEVSGMFYYDRSFDLKISEHVAEGEEPLFPVVPEGHKIPHVRMHLKREDTLEGDAIVTLEKVSLYGEN